MSAQDVHHAPATSAPVTWRTKFFYGLSDMPVQMAIIPIAAFLPNYYGSDLGLSLAAVGTIWLVTRLFDAVTDPLVGYLSDRTRTRWGRRRIWMIASCPILMISIYKLFLPQPPVTEFYVLFWLTVFWLGWTMLFIPYYAWAAELSSDYHERSSIAAWRVGVGMVANIFGKLMPVLALYLFAFGGTANVMMLTGLMLLVMTPLCVILTVTQVPEKANFKPAYVPLLKGLSLMWKNRPFRQLSLVFFACSLGGSISTATIIFFIRGVLKEEGGGVLMLLVYYATLLVSIPFWVWFSKRVGKHKALIAGLMMFPLFQPFNLLLGPGDFYWMLPIACMTGFGGGAWWVLPSSMKADVIDLDRLESGDDRAAWFFGVWSLILKLAQSVGPWLALLLLGYVGYQAAPGAENTAEATLAMKLVYVGGPTLGYLAAALLTLNYSLTESQHKEIREALDRRDGAVGAPP
jgi:GPH family glycoside/pentoside/hexuronide:cation symporter